MHHDNPFGKLNDVVRVMQRHDQRHLPGLRESAHQIEHEKAVAVIEMGVRLVEHENILVLDEPNTHLDYRNRFLVLDLVRRLAEARQMTLIMSLHDPNDVIQFAERVVVMHEGRVVADGRPAEVIDEALLAEYFGIRAVALKNAAGNLIFKAVEAL